MIIKVLGILDILSAIIFFLYARFNFIPEILIAIIYFYLIIKGLIFLLSADIASVLDILCGLAIFVSTFFPLHPIIKFILIIYLLQKGFLSLVS